MEGRLRDLVSTADRQLAAKSYDAAIDTYRTALAEPDAVGADIEARLEVACRARDAARRLRDARNHYTAGHLREAFAAVAEALSWEPSNTEAAELRQQLLKAMPELATLAVAAAAPPPSEVVEVAPAAVPAGWSKPPEPTAPKLAPPKPRPPKPNFRTIEPPKFHLIEDDPSLLEWPRRTVYSTPIYEGEPPLSILDPTPRPAEPDAARVAAIVGAIIVALIASGIVSATRRHVPSFSPPTAVRTENPAYPAGRGVTPPAVINWVKPEYTAAARQAQIEGTVILFVEVETDGSATVRGILQSLEPDLDVRAVEAVNHWRFQPGRKDGVPVRASTKVEVSFRL